ncbi:phosphoinositide-interacting protein [Latimeria chalumnae]|uniref:phosphoinositide-interacting protein n=1 Tax=Latimeria chalumnae TaxID=7897 RepID=UPI0003C1AE8C|nr:PREDICTED: phosphoinositide-interacting protein [Latimeria chalumnae]|eukprot:XP_006012617.1 PREDICTED: phosphoinositide-interacting protein [Latimeria chalumnae]
MENEKEAEIIPLGDLSFSESKDLLTSQTASTCYSGSRSDSLWTTESRSAWETYYKPIVVLSVGGAIFIFGVVLTGLYFAQINKKAANILGPASLSIGLMFLVVGLVWVPIIKEKRQQKSASKLFRNPKQPFFQLFRD